MSNTQSEAMTRSWYKQAFFRTYRFWGLVLVIFLIHFSESANLNLLLGWSMHDVPYENYAKFTYLGTLIAGLFSVYFLRTRFKNTLVIFALVYLLSLLLMRFGPTTHSGIYLAAVFFKNIGYFGIILTILAVLVMAKIPLKSFLIAVLIIWFWQIIGQALAFNYSYSYSDLEHQILGFYDDESAGDLKASGRDVWLYNASSFLPPLFAVLAAARLNSKKLFEKSIPKASIKPALLEKAEPSAWLWQDLVSHYRFWGLVLVSFLIALTKAANLFSGRYHREGFIDEFGQGLYTCIAYTPSFIAGLLILYFLKGRIKAAMIGFCLLFLISLSLVNIAVMPNSASFMAVVTLKNIGYFGVLITILAALLTAKLPLKSFLIAFFIIGFWTYIGEILGYAYNDIDFRYTPIDDKRTPPLSYVFYQSLAPLTPAAFAVLAALKLKPEMFFSPPDVTVEANLPKVRDPFAVFVFSFIVPFYVLYWLFKQPGELKTLAPDMHQPSPRGALCLGLFAPLILPMWFADVRKGLTPPLKDRSARRIAAASFISPAIAAGMAQADCNHIANKNSHSTDA